MQNARNILLLTSTINPRNTNQNLALSSAEERLKDYTNALAFYERQIEAGVITNIVYVDNSEYPLDSLIEKFTHPAF